MRISWGGLLATAVLAAPGIASAKPTAQGFIVAPPPWAICASSASTDEAVLIHSLMPAENATVPLGAPLTFSGSSSAPLTFAIATSPALLSTNPDVDQGAGELQPAAGGPQTYSFTSTAATAKPGTIYWSASFSDSTLPECAGLTPSTYTTPARALTIASAPASAPATPEAPSPAPAAPPAPLQAGLKLAAGDFGVHHPLVAYRVRCSLRCTGQASCRAYELERHRRTPGAPALDLPLTTISIAAPSGEQRVAHRYAGAALRALRQLAHAGDQLELHCELAVSAEPNAGPVRSATWLRP
jgi:ribonuclease E